MIVPQFETIISINWWLARRIDGRNQMLISTTVNYLVKNRI